MVDLAIWDIDVNMKIKDVYGQYLRKKIEIGTSVDEDEISLEHV